MKVKTVTAVLLTTLLVAPAGGAWAAGPKGGPPPGGRGPNPCGEKGAWGHHFHHHPRMGPATMWMIDDMGALLKLGLTDEQLAKARTIHQDLLAKNLEMHGKVLEASAQLPKLWAATPMDAAAIDKVYGRIFALYQEMIRQHIQAHNQIMALLDTNQRQRYERWRSGTMMMEGGQGMGPGMGPGMGWMGD